MPDPWVIATVTQGYNFDGGPLHFVVFSTHYEGISFSPDLKSLPRFFLPRQFD